MLATIDIMPIAVARLTTFTIAVDSPPEIVAPVLPNLARSLVTFGVLNVQVKQ